LDPLKTILEKILAHADVKSGHFSLCNMQRLCEMHHQPQNAFPTIHVAGTNGKGSVCTKVAAALQAEGYKTGLYTSPHIASFRERIQINGEMISEAELAALYKEVHATYFEIATLLAFLHFQRNQVDIAIIETGIGGRLDPTNVVTPILSIITSIGYDHMDILGASLEEIALEKAGIIKRNVPVVIGRDVPYSVMKNKAHEMNSPLYQSSVQDLDFDKENQATARLALSLLPQFPVSEASILTGLKTMPPCRFERHSCEKEVIFDVAHNAHGFQRLIEILKHTYPKHDYRFVVGFSKGKDVSGCAVLIQNVASAIHLVSGIHPRLAQAEELQYAFTNPYLEESITEGLQHALQAFNPNPEVVVIAGSFFIMDEGRSSCQEFDRRYTN
jgi:dihydrofolate synthase / folylpolyglutamate synthase